MKFDVYLIAALVLFAGLGARAQFDDFVMMERPDGSKQCEPKPIERRLIARTKAELRRAKVSVLEMRHTSDGRMHAQMCGSPTGMVVRIRIRSSDQPKAAALGFSPTPVSD